MITTSVVFEHGFVYRNAEIPCALVCGYSQNEVIDGLCRYRFDPDLEFVEMGVLQAKNVLVVRQPLFSLS